MTHPIIDLDPISPPLAIPPFLRTWAPYFFLVSAVLLVWSNCYDNAFLYDDESLIIKNAFLRGWSDIGAIFSTSITAGANLPGGFYRPLQIFLYLLLYHMGGLSPVPYHLLNVALHAANACLIYRLGQRLRFNAKAAFFASLVWALHPVQVEAVTYMSGTADPLFFFFMLLGLIVCVPRFKPVQIAFAALFFILALLAKEEAVVFPLLASVCLFALDRRRFKPLLYVKLWPLFLIAIAYVEIHEHFLIFDNFQLYSQDDLYAHSVAVRIYTSLATLPGYLQFILWPVHLHFDRDFKPVTDPWAWRVLVGIMLTLAAWVIILRSRRRRALALSWGLLWFMAAHLLHTGILRPVNSLLLEHWLYVPFCGLCLGTAETIARRWDPIAEERNRVIKWAVGALICLLAFLSFRQNEIWADPETFYLNIFKNGEPSPHAHNNLGVEYSRTGRYDKAIEQFYASILGSGDTNAVAHHDLAITYLNGPDAREYRQEAIRHLKRALEIAPDYYASAIALEELYRENNDPKNQAYYKAAAERALGNVGGKPIMPRPLITE